MVARKGSSNGRARSHNRMPVILARDARPGRGASGVLRSSGDPSHFGHSWLLFFRPELRPFIESVPHDETGFDYSSASEMLSSAKA